ncbi:MAG: Fe-S oxidoreductase, partial [Chitinophagaceae bacterium]
MQLVQQILFAALAALAIWLFAKKIKQVRRNILLGRDEVIETDKGKRISNVLLLAFGQKKMFKKPLVAIMHFIIYAGFIIINIEVLEIALDGIFGTHRMFSGLLGRAYG